MYKIGVVKQSRLDEFAARKETPPSLHSPEFYPDPNEALRVSVPSMADVVLKLLPPEKANAAGE
jgi:hippurate hydrolase